VNQPIDLYSVPVVTPANGASHPIDPGFDPGPDDGHASDGGIKGELAARTKEPPTLKLWDPADIWAPLPEPDYVVQGLAVRGSLALAVSTGSEWLGMACQQGEALYIDFESGSYELRRRAHKIARGHGYTIPIAGFTFTSMPGLSLADDAFFAALAPLAKRFAFIVIDSLSAGSSGVDENDVRFARPLNRLKALAEETGCVIVIIHHSKKAGGDPNKRPDDREMVRGSSAIFNACDVVLCLVRGEDDLFIVRQTKARGGKAVAPFTVRVDDVGEDACRVMAGELQEDEGPKESPSRSLQAAKRTVLALLADARDLKSKNAVFRRTKGKRGTVFDALDELQEDGLVVVHEGAFRLASEVT
jgi:hypothetical protein